MNRVVHEDAEHIALDESIPWEVYEGKTILVTGATGLIGQSLVAALLAREQLRRSGLAVVCLVRNLAKARAIFGDERGLHFRSWDAKDPDSLNEERLEPNVIIHCANMTSSSDFINYPVEVINTTVNGARAMLDLARRAHARICILSTMEVYGEVCQETKLTEDTGGFLDPMAVRNSYPEAKRLDEALCASYCAEYGVESVVVRLVQTFGPGVPRDDGRVFAEFARCAIDGEDIVLLTSGEKSCAYLYTLDAVKALLIATAKGVSGNAYNAANEATFCKIKDMAQMVATRFGRDGCQVRIEVDDVAARRFRNSGSLQLDASKLRELGWEPNVALGEMYERMIMGWE